MNRKVNPIIIRQSSTMDSPQSLSPPVMSPSRHVRTGSNDITKKTHTKAAAQRLAQVMSSNLDDEDEEDDLAFDLNRSAKGSIGLAGGRRMPRPQSPTVRRPQSPAMRGSIASPMQMKKSQPVDTISSIQMKKSQSVESVNVVQIKKLQPGDVVDPLQMKKTESVDDDEDYFANALMTGPVSIGRAGGKSMRKRSPKKSQSVESIMPIEIKKSESVDVPSRIQMQKSQPVNTINPAQMKKPQLVDGDEEDFANEYGLVTGPVSIGRAGGRTMRNPSLMPIRTKQEQTMPHLIASNKSSQSISSMEQPSPSVSSILPSPSSQSTNGMEQPLSAGSSMVGRSFANRTEKPLYVRPSYSIQSSPNSIEQPPPIRRPNIKNVLVPSTVPISLRQVSPTIGSEPLVDNRRDKRTLIDSGVVYQRDTTNYPTSSTLRDEVYMLQEENENLIQKLRLAEERCDKVEARARQLEKQIANLGESVPLEAHLLSKKETTLQPKEVDKDETTFSPEQLHEAELEIKSLRSITQRMILTQEEMEEVVLKRCWLARYWNLCVQYDVHPEVATTRYEYWSSFAPLPIEVVLAAGQRAKEGNSSVNNDADERERTLKDMSELIGDGNIESMLVVEKGLRELASLKVEDAVALAMAQQRRTISSKLDEVKLLSDGQIEAFELSKQECDDVRFKQSWLTYFWRRAKDHGLEPDIAEERLQFWNSHNSHSITSHDVVDVERGLLELNKLGIESQLWLNSRKGLEIDSNL